MDDHTVEPFTTTTAVLSRTAIAQMDLSCGWLWSTTEWRIRHGPDCRYSHRTGLTHVGVRRKNQARHTPVYNLVALCFRFTGAVNGFIHKFELMTFHSPFIWNSSFNSFWVTRNYLVTLSALVYLAAVSLAWKKIKKRENTQSTHFVHNFEFDMKTNGFPMAAGSITSDRQSNCLVNIFGFFPSWFNGTQLKRKSRTENQREKERPSNLNRFNCTWGREEIIVEQLNMRWNITTNKKKRTNEKRRWD